MWVNPENESLQAQWKSDFRMEQYSFEKLVEILILVLAKNILIYKIYYNPDACGYCSIETFNWQMHSVQQLKHLLLDFLHIFRLQQFFVTLLANY